MRKFSFFTTVTLVLLFISSVTAQEDTSPNQHIPITADNIIYLTPLYTIENPDHNLNGFMSPDGHYIVLSKTVTTVYEDRVTPVLFPTLLWDISNLDEVTLPERIQPLEEKMPVHSWSFSSNSELLVSLAAEAVPRSRFDEPTSRSIVRLFNVKTGEQLGVIDIRDEAYTVLDEKAENVYDPELVEQLRAAGIYHLSGKDVVLSPDGETILVSVGVSYNPVNNMTYINHVTLMYDTDTLEYMGVWESRDNKRSVSLPLLFSPDGLTLASNDFLYEWHTRRQIAQLEDVRAIGRQSSEVAFSPDGSKIAKLNYLGDVAIWDTETGAALSLDAGPTKEEDNVAEDHRPGIAFSPDGSLLVTGEVKAGYEPEGLRVWDVDSGEQIARITSPRIFKVIGFTPDGTLLAVADYDKIHLLGINPDFENMPTCMATVRASAAVNVRSGPGSNHGIRITLVPGANVFVVKESNGWYQILSGDTEGWVSGELLSLDAAQCTDLMG